MEYKVISNIVNHIKLQDQITLKLWPEFMLHDPVSNSNWSKLFELFPDFQISLEANGEIIAVANSLPYYWDKEFEDLPEQGWDWVLEKGIADSENNIKANILNGLQIAINNNYQGKGLSSLALKEMAIIARNHGFKYLTIPVRPSLKSIYPLIPMDKYMKWEREDGLPYDSWLRVHVRQGGKIIKACHQAMYIPGTIKEWEEWTGMKFLETGSYIVEGALSPVEMNLEKDLGEYTETNVWVLHEIK